MARSRITAVIVPPPAAPATEAELTPEQERQAIAALATVLGILARVPARTEQAA